ncbi:GAF domain containing protein [Methylophilaceae bacterium]
MLKKLSSESLINLIHDSCQHLVNEEHLDVLLENFTFLSQKVLNADGSTLYLAKNGKLYFHYVSNQSLNISWGTDSKKLAELQPILIDGSTNTSISVKCFLQKKTINIKNIYEEASESTEATRIFDAQFNYKTKSILNIPILGHKKNILGVMQAINALDENNQTTSFDEESIKIAECLAILIGCAIESRL